MISRARTKAIQGLIVGTLALSSHFPDADAAVAGNTDPFVEALVAEVERNDLDVPDRASVLRRLALSPSRAIRSRVAEAAGALSNEDPGALSLLRQLSHDASDSVRAAAARGLAHFMDHASDPVRSSVESAWATATVSDERVALARALGMATPHWLTELAIQELAADASAPVRRAALQAARAQLLRNPTPYVQLAAVCSADSDRRVRKSARQLLRRAEATGSPIAIRPTFEALRASRHRLRRALREWRHVAPHDSERVA